METGQIIIIRLLLALGVVALPSMARADDDDGEAVRTRLDSEATTLFAQVVKDRTEPFPACELEARWGKYPVDYDTAHKALGLDIHADLTAPTAVGDPMAIIGKQGKLEGVICDAEAYKRRVASLVEARQRALEALPVADRKAGEFYVPHMSYTFPIFDGTFCRAVIVRQGEAGSVRLDADGKRVRSTLEGGGSELVYRREDERWREVDETEIYNFD